MIISGTHWKFFQLISYAIWLCNVAVMSGTRRYSSRTVKDVFGWFWSFTSFGGFTQSRESDNLISKWAWFILALFGYAITLFQCYQTVSTFFNWETDTKMTFATGTAFKSQIKFPAVTVCNSNRVHCGHLYDEILNCTQVGFGY